MHSATRTAFIVLISMSISISASALIELGEYTPCCRHDAVITDIIMIEDDLAVAYSVINGVRVVDISDPATPAEIAVVDNLEEFARMDFLDGKLYVAGYTGGYFRSSVLRIFDLSSPAAPVQISVLDTPGHATSVSVAAGYAYLADGAGGFRVIDVSNPAQPVEISSLALRSDDVKVEGQYAYVIGRDTGFSIIDITNPHQPSIVSSMPNSSLPKTLDIDAGHAFVGDFAGLKIIDVRIPSSPVEVSRLDGVGTVFEFRAVNELAVDGDIAWLAVEAEGLLAVDISDLANPKPMGVLYEGGGGGQQGTPRAIGVADGIVCTGIRRFLTVDSSQPLYPIRIGDFPTGGVASDFEIFGELGFLTFEFFSKRLAVLDLSDPSSIIEVGSLDMPDDALGLEVVNHVAFIAVEDSGLLLADVSIPSDPQLISLTATPNPALDVKVDNGFAYVMEQSGIRIFDVTDTNSVHERSMIPLGTRVEEIEVVNGIAHVAVASVSDHILMFDVSDADNPVQIGAYRTPTGTWLSTNDLDAVDGTLFVVNQRSIQVIDVNDPAQPEEIGGWFPKGTPGNNVPFQGRSLAVAGDSMFALSADESFGLDISNLHAPRRLGGYPGRADVKIEIDRRLVYEVDRFGIRITDFGPEYFGVSPVTIDIKPGSDPNSINPSLEGDLPVAILGSDTFDVLDVDVTTLAFGPSGASFTHRNGPHFEDVNGDGLTDLMAHYRIEEAGIAFGDMEACLRGERLDGSPFSGCDSVRTVPDMDGDKLLDVEEATIGTDALNADTDGDGFDGGEEVLVMGTDPLDPLDPTPDPVPEPARWLMLVAGMAFLGLLYRRRGQENGAMGGA
jgi:hypothetical protein